MELGLIFLACAVVLAALVLAFTLRKAPETRPDPRLDVVITTQGEIKGQFQQTIASQAELRRTLSERIDALNNRMGESLTENATKTAATIASIGERLTVIDEAQKNISQLSNQVVSLEQIFSDKQQRGAFAQERMEAIVADHFPPEHYNFQFTLSNGKRPDCVIRIPNVPEMIVIDAKFPLEAFEALRNAVNDDDRKSAAQRVRTDVQNHARDIAERYLLPGETQRPAIMFVPSESIYSELHMSFPELIQAARRRQVMIMSPHVFLLALATIQALTRDAKMREQAYEIQKEVGTLLKDVKLLGERVADLRVHFERTSKDIGEIEKPMGRIVNRAGRIEAVELAPPETEVSTLPPTTSPVSL